MASDRRTSPSWNADGDIGPEEAVKAYHGVLQSLGITPHRSLKEDMQLQTGVMSHGGKGTTISDPLQAKPNSRADK